MYANPTQLPIKRGPLEPCNGGKPRYLMNDAPTASQAFFNYLALVLAKRFVEIKKSNLPLPLYQRYNVHIH